MTINDLPEDIRPKQSDFKKWQTEARIRALTAICKLLVVILIAVISFYLGRTI